MKLKYRDLTKRCPDCSKPGVDSYGCRRCKGQGRVPNKAGKAILLLLHHFKDYDDEDEDDDPNLA